MLNDISIHDKVNRLSPTASGEIERLVHAALGQVFPAVTLVAVRDGRVMLHRAWGWADPETQRQPAQTGTLFDLASITKIFSTTALMALLNANTLEFNTPLVDVLPEFGAGGWRAIGPAQDPLTLEYVPVPDALRGKQVDPGTVTLWHLLTHTSGLAPWRDLYSVAGPVPVAPDAADPVSHHERWIRGVQAICDSAFADLPGVTVHYSDLGLILLGEVVRRLHGGDLDDALRKYVIEPLALESPVYNPLQNGQQRDNIHPTEYDARWRGRRVWGEVHDENTCGLGGVSSHAGLFSAGLDVAKLGQAWLARDERLAIPAAWMDTATREQARTGDVRRGLGWQLKAKGESSIGELMSEKTYGHTGFTGNSMWIDPERALVVVILTNAVYYGRDFSGLYAFRRAMNDALTRATDGNL